MLGRLSAKLGLKAEDRAAVEADLLEAGALAASGNGVS